MNYALCAVRLPKSGGCFGRVMKGNISHHSMVRKRVEFILNISEFDMHVQAR